MNPRYHHYNIMQQPFVYYGYPVFAPPFVYNQVIISPSRYNAGRSESVEYVDDVAILNTPNTLHHSWVIQPHMHHSSYLHGHHYLPYPTPENPSFHSSIVSRAFEQFLEESMIMHELEADSSLQDGASGSGLSEEKISENLHVYTTQEKKTEGEDVDACSICLDEFGENEQVGILECGHKYHPECIKCWLLSKNVCPLCRSTALKV